MTTTTTASPWRSFQTGKWEQNVDVRDFIIRNFTCYEGDEEFLAEPTQNTLDLWDLVTELTAKERKAGGVLDMDTKIPSTITSHGPGYLDKDKEKIVGVQTDKPFKRALMPFGGIRMAKNSCEAYGYELDKETEAYFHRVQKNS